MNVLLRYFAQGCLVTVPLAITAYAFYFTFTRLDALMPVGVPAVGVVLLIGGITGIGYVSSSFLGGFVVRAMDRWVQRVPLAGLLYNSVRDLLGAFVGERRAFERPVVVSLGVDGDVRVLGFLTREGIPFLQDHVAVYLPQAYNFAGNLIVCRAERVTPLEVDRADLMAFIVSGGVTSKHGELSS